MGDPEPGHEADHGTEGAGRACQPPHEISARTLGPVRDRARVRLGSIRRLGFGDSAAFASFERVPTNTRS
jgi:hypothetical protein